MYRKQRPGRRGLHLVGLTVSSAIFLLVLLVDDRPNKQGMPLNLVLNTGMADASVSSSTVRDWAGKPVRALADSIDRSGVPTTPLDFPACADDRNFGDTDDRPLGFEWNPKQAVD